MWMATGAYQGSIVIDRRNLFIPQNEDWQGWITKVAQRHHWIPAQCACTLDVAYVRMSQAFSECGRSPDHN